MKNILILGAGNMGGAMGKALLEKKFVDSSHLFVVDSSEEKLQFFSEKKCKTSVTAHQLLPEMDIVILAVKPQSMPETLAQMTSFFKKDVLLVSIAAGFSVKNIQKITKKENVVRVMPNTPLLVGKGISGYFCDESVSEEWKNFLQNMLQCFGVAIACDKEDKINAITALSGSGPAYFFRILEIFSENAQAFGFSEDDAKKIALSTLLGAGMLAEHSSEKFSTLRENVTSKGGTTAAALESFEKNDFSGIWKNAFAAAFNRAKELSV